MRSQEQRAAGKAQRNSIHASIGLPNYDRLIEIEPNPSYKKIPAVYRRTLPRTYHCHLPDNLDRHQKSILVCGAYEFVPNLEQHASYDIPPRGWLSRG